MNFGLAFGYIFKDQDWFKKLLVAVLCSLIPLIGWFVVLGWAAKVAKNVIKGDAENALPALDFGENLKDGFVLFVVSLVYLLPFLLFVALFATLMALFGNQISDGMAAVAMLLYLVGIAVLVLPLVFILPAAWANYLGKGRFAAAFNFKEIFGMFKVSFGSWLLMFLAEIMCDTISSSGILVCFVGVAFTAVFSYLVYFHLLGQAYIASQPVLVSTEPLEALPPAS